MAIGHAIHEPAIHHEVSHRRAMPLALAPATYVLLRAGAGILFMQHGLQKIFGMLGGMGGSGATAPLASLMGGAGLLELVGGALLVLGLFVRPTAFVLAGEMVVAYFMTHFPKGGWPIQNGGEMALLYAIIFAFLFAHGAGPLSLDRRMKWKGWFSSGWREAA